MTTIKMFKTMSYGGVEGRDHVERMVGSLESLQAYVEAQPPCQHYEVYAADAQGMLSLYCELASSGGDDDDYLPEDEEDE